MDAKRQAPGRARQNRKIRDEIAQHLCNLNLEWNTLPVRGI
jgi:hypothetical protein